MASVWSPATRNEQYRVYFKYTAARVFAQTKVPARLAAACWRSRPSWTSCSQALKAGRRVKLPNGEQRVDWVNAANVNETEAEMIALWNELHPDDPIEE
jgi:hypothetical protein